MCTTVPGRYAFLGVKASVVGFGCDHAPAVDGNSLGSDRAVTGASGAVPDPLIASCAQQHSADVVHADRHYDLLSRVLVFTPRRLA
jgi:hypothetical protein